MASNPIFRSRPQFMRPIFWRRTQAVRERSAKPLCTSSNLVDASVAEVVKLVDTRDLKSLGPISPCRFDSGPRYLI